MNRRKAYPISDKLALMSRVLPSDNTKCWGKTAHHLLWLRYLTPANMIPVRKYCLIDFDFMAEPDKRYQALLMNQLAYCEKNKELIASRAKKTYEKAVQGNTPFYRKICCDFKRLESVCDKYKVKKAAR